MSLKKVLSQFVLILAMSVCESSSGNAQPLFEVERGSFAKGVQRNEPIEPVSGFCEIKAEDGIFFWMQIKVDKRALTMLEAKGQMPIYHAWGSGRRITDIIDVGIKEEIWTHQENWIRNQIKRQGFFIWRTYSSKRNLQPGHWYVSVLDANKKAVRQAGSGVDACRPGIVVRLATK